jgi:hypothetical protein
MSSASQDKDSGSAGFADSLRDIQGEYMMLGELYEKQKSYGQRLSEMMKTLQFEVDTVIPIRAEALGRPCRSAYLVSEGVVVVFDTNGGLTSKPLYALPPETIISIIQDCTPELQRLLSEKRRAESNKVKSMERVLKELKKAQATFKQTKRDETVVEEEEEAPGEQKPKEEEEEEFGSSSRSQKDSFAFRGSFGEKKDVATVQS